MTTAEQWQMDNDGSTCTLKLTLHHLHQCDEYPMVAVERSMSAMVTWANLLSGNNANISRASFTFDYPNYKSKLAPVFGKNITFSSNVNSLECPSMFLEEPIQTSCLLLRTKSQRGISHYSGLFNGQGKDKGLVIGWLTKGKIPSIESSEKTVRTSKKLLTKPVAKELEA